MFINFSIVLAAEVEVQLQQQQQMLRLTVGMYKTALIYVFIKVQSFRIKY